PLWHRSGRPHYDTIEAAARHDLPPIRAGHLDAGQAHFCERVSAYSRKLALAFHARDVSRVPDGDSKQRCRVTGSGADLENVVSRLETGVLQHADGRHWRRHAERPEQ